MKNRQFCKRYDSCYSTSIHYPFDGVLETGNEVPGNRLRVRIPCPPLVFQEKPALGFSRQPVLESPKTLQYDYPQLIDATVGKVSRKAYEKYKDDPEAYVKARRSDARGKVFEATVAHEARRNTRFNTRTAKK